MSEEEKKRFQGIELNPERLSDAQYFVKKFYHILVNPQRPMTPDSINVRLDLIQAIENKLRTQFLDTADMKDKVDRYLDGYDLRKSDPRTRLRKARKKCRMSQKQLAERVGYSSHVPINQMERGRRHVSKQVLMWLEDIGM